MGQQQITWSEIYEKCRSLMTSETLHAARVLVVGMEPLPLRWPIAFDTSPSKTTVSYDIVIAQSEVLNSHGDPLAHLTKLLTPNGVCLVWNKGNQNFAELSQSFRNVFPFVVEPIGRDSFWVLSGTPIDPGESIRLRRDNIRLANACDTFENEIQRLTREIASSTQKLESLIDQTDRLSAELAHAKEKLTIIEKSRSWRLTQAYWRFMDNSAFGRVAHGIRQRVRNAGGRRS